MVTIEKTEPGNVTYRALGQTFVSGDTADVSEEIAAWLCDECGEFERVGDAGADSEEGAEDDAFSGKSSGTLPFNPKSHTVDEVREKVDEVDDPEAVGALRDIEADQKDRTGATDALDDRLDELTGNDGEE